MAAQPTTTLGTGRAVTAPSRRHLIGGSILAALSGAAFAGAVVLPNPGEAFPAATGPDAELIRLCAECDALQARIDKQYTTPWEHLSPSEAHAREVAIDAAIEPLTDAQDLLLERICAMRATTPQGHAARARTLIAWDKDPCWTDDECWNNQLIGAIVRDLVGEV